MNLMQTKNLKLQQLELLFVFIPQSSSLFARQNARQSWLIAYLIRNIIVQQPKLLQ
jgi:hypothetical protein